jgi:hypothetical protein
VLLAIGLLMLADVNQFTAVMFQELIKGRKQEARRRFFATYELGKGLEQSVLVNILLFID